ncbi:MAG: DNA-binding protein [Alphaproteobacteria bacterium]|nr:DNA-binding protein [Alphaproteobacteria bacterium]
METPLQIAFKDTPGSRYLESQIRRRAERLDRLHPNLIGCRVVVDAPRGATGAGKPALRVAVEVEAPGQRMLVGKSQQAENELGKDPSAAMIRAFDAVHRQLEKHDDVQRGEVKRHDGAGETGRVLRLYPESNYGFIEVAGGSELYFTSNAVDGDAYGELEVGMMVEVTRATTEGPMGPQASVVRLLGRERTTR